MEGGGGMLQLAVQSVEWTYSVYWRFSTQQGMLVWGDGFYNGGMKTTKSLHPAEVAPTASQSAVDRTRQLRDLYSSLSASALPRPSAALSPEDLTHSEWFYLLCLSFSFPPGLGLPGNAFANNKHVWITGANHIHTKIFSRAILAKSADIKTVVCIPVMDGVVELGTTDTVNEDIGFIQHIKSIFGAESTKAVLSELSTSNSATSLDRNDNNRKEIEKQMDSDSSTSNSNTGGDGELIMQHDPSQSQPQPQPQLDDDYNNFLPLSHSQQSTQFLQPPPLSVAGLTEEDTHYSNTLSALLLSQSTRWTETDSSSLTCSSQSAFSNWTHLRRPPTETTTTSQCFLKNILYTVPFLHIKRHHDIDHNPFKSKLDNKFIILRSIVPFATKMDQASILGDTVEYLKHLRQKIQHLEAQNRQLELHGGCLHKRKPRILEDGCTKHKVLKSPPMTTTSQHNTNLQVSIIGSEGLLELQCPYREGLLLHILLILQGMRIETTAVTSSTNNGVFVAKLWAKVMEHVDGKKASILEVKRAIHQIIPCID